MRALPFEKIKRKVLVRHPRIKIAKEPYKPSVDELFLCGVVNLDKPAHMLSRAAVRKVKNILEVPKAGHAGTLDPAVTGALPVFLQKGTKLTGILSEAGKRYEGLMRLHGGVSDEKLKEGFKHFTGKIIQTPPKLSAVKRVPREREVYWFEITKREERNVWFDVGCQAGTYIRKLCHDLGERLGCGAHMRKLRRLQAGPFKIEDSVSLDKVAKNYKSFLKTGEEQLVREIVLPIEGAVNHLGWVWIDPEVKEKLKHGSPIFASGIAALHTNIKEGDFVAIMLPNNQLAGIGIAKMSSEKMLKANRGLAVKTDIVMI